MRSDKQIKLDKVISKRTRGKPAIELTYFQELLGYAFPKVKT